MEKLIKTILHQTQKDGGFTVDITNSAIPTEGFMVSTGHHEKLFQKSTFGPVQIQYFIEEYLMELRNGGYLQTRVSANIVYMDVSRVFTNKHIALKTAREHQQLSIYDVENKTVINL